MMDENTGYTKPHLTSYTKILEWNPAAVKTMARDARAFWSLTRDSAGMKMSARVLDVEQGRASKTEKQCVVNLTN